jgi:hypothetical protein
VALCEPCDSSAKSWPIAIVSGASKSERLSQNEPRWLWFARFTSGNQKAIRIVLLKGRAATVGEQARQRPLSRFGSLGGPRHHLTSFERPPELRAQLGKSGQNERDTVTSASALPGTMSQIEVAPAELHPVGGEPNRRVGRRASATLVGAVMAGTDYARRR